MLTCESAALAAGGRVVAAAYAGSRLITADERHELRVFEREGEAWSGRASWRAHDAALRGVAWASPAFGSIAASCSDDGLVKVWLVLPPTGEARLLATLGGDRAAPVVCVAFAPPEHGLVVAAAGSDGVVRLYESADRTGASGWDEQGTFEAGAACTTLAWCLRGAAPPALAVGVAGAPARVWVFDAPTRRWRAACVLHGAPVSGLSWARNDGRPWELLAGSSGATALVWRVSFDGAQATSEVAADTFTHGGDVCSLDWDFTGTRLASAALDGRVRLWTANVLGEWGEYVA